MKKTFITSLSIILVTVLAFVCISKPLQARADSASMDYVETDLSTSDVKALFSGSAAFIPAAIMIIGFIVMCYCVLRNVEVPLNFADQTSFSDKLTQLGQYAIDNAGDSIKDFLYSVYTYCNDNGITSIWGLSKFIGLQAGKFFGAITSWIGGSLINNPSNVGQDLTEFFTGNTLYNYSYPFSYSAEVASIFPYNFDFYSTIGYASATTYNANYTFFTNFQIPSTVNAILIYNTASRVQVAFYNIGSSAVKITNVLCQTSTFKFANTTNQNPNVSPNLSSYTTGSFNTTTFNFDFSSSYYYVNVSSLLMSLSLLGLPIYFSNSALSNTLPLQNIYLLNDVLNPAVDNVYVPTDVWNIDIVGTWEQIARDVSATYDQTERIAAFVGDIPLTLTSAQAYAPTINDAGNYVFPDMTDIWKYPQYFFDTLKGWGSFVGNCLRSVTVGEGGLSWIFYGGFVLLVCGGIIGKILMG